MRGRVSQARIYLSKVFQRPGSLDTGSGSFRWYSGTRGSISCFCQLTNEFCDPRCLLLHSAPLPPVDRQLCAEGIVQKADDGDAAVQSCVLPLSAPELHSSQAQKDDGDGDQNHIFCIISLNRTLRVTGRWETRIARLPVVRCTRLVRCLSSFLSKVFGSVSRGRWL